MNDLSEAEGKKMRNTLFQLSRGLQMDSSEEIAKMPTGMRGSICSVSSGIHWEKIKFSAKAACTHFPDDGRVVAGTHS